MFFLNVKYLGEKFKSIFTVQQKGWVGLLKGNCIKRRNSTKTSISVLALMHSAWGCSPIMWEQLSLWIIDYIKPSGICGPHKALCGCKKGKFCWLFQEPSWIIWECINQPLGAVTTSNQPRWIIWLITDSSEHK